MLSSPSKNRTPTAGGSFAPALRCRILDKPDGIASGSAPRSGAKTLALAKAPLSQRTANRNPRGFTLLEVSVALAVLGLVLVTMMQVISGGLTLEHKAGKLGRAAVRARALMDQVVTEMEMQNRIEEGVGADGLRWSRTIRAASIEDGNQAQDEDFELDHEYTLRFLEVTVAWDEGDVEKTYTVQSLRVTALVE